MAGTISRIELIFDRAAKHASREKGRIRVGADADITVFDRDRVIDRATYEDPMQPSAGIAHVLVGGVFVVRDGHFVADSFRMLYFVPRFREHSVIG